MHTFILSILIYRMVPITRSKARETMPKRPPLKGDCISRTKIEFFRDYNNISLSQILSSISVKSQVTKQCGRNWLKQHCKLGSLVYHYTRKLSKALDTKSRVTKAIIDILLSLLYNLVRNQTLEAQI